MILRFCLVQKMHLSLLRRSFVRLRYLSGNCLSGFCLLTCILIRTAYYYIKRPLFDFLLQSNANCGTRIISFKLQPSLYKMDDISSILEMTNDKLAGSQQDKLLLEPFEYIRKIPDRQIPLKFFRALNYWFDIPFEKFSLIVEIVDMLQKASILIDDIEDNSKTRQGSPVAHLIYGVPFTLNAATYVLSTIPERIQLLDHPEAMKVFIEEMQKIHRGQGMDIYWRDNFKPPSYLEYKLMAVQNLGSVFRFGARMMQLFCTKTIDISRLIVIIGIYFQIWDDYHTLSEDITEGKFGFPMVHAVHSEKNSGKVLSILKQRSADVNVIKDCISHMQTLGSLQFSYDSLISLGKVAREEVAKLGPNSLMDGLLKEFGSPKAASDLIRD